MNEDPTSLFGYSISSTLVLPLLAIVPFVLFNLGYLTYVGKDQNGKPKEASEFGGPIGSFFIVFILPVISYFLYFGCNKDQVVSVNPFSPEFMKFNVNPLENGISGFIDHVWDFKVFLVFSGWVFFQWLLYLIVPGEIVDGQPLPAPHSGKTLKYKINALRCHIITLILLVVLVKFDIISGSYAYDHFVQLLTGALVFTFTMSVLLYLHSRITIPNDDAQRRSPLHLISQSGNSDNIFYDFWMGRTLNPRIGMLDLKYVCELRPGLILWVVFNFSMAYKQYETLGYVSSSMILVCLFEWYYVLDSHLNEKAILTTMDITTDGFGFMLVHGDMAWVPFNYCLQARYLVDYSVEITPLFFCIIVFTKLLGIYIFRSSNNQKDRFRKDPNGEASKHIKYIETKSGSRLMTSGWWGIARHINYFGDIVMAISWSLPTGFSTILTYFYPIYFTVLLLQRERRDEAKCIRKYGKDWDRYCEIVPYRIFPGIY